MNKKSLLHGALILGLAVFGIDYNARHVGYDLGKKQSEAKIEQMQRNYEQTKKNVYNDGYKAARLFDKIDMANMKNNYEGRINELELKLDVSGEKIRHDSFKRGWELGWDRAAEKYASQPEPYIDEEPICQASPGGSPDSMDSRTGNEKLLRVFDGIRESTDELTPYDIPDFTP